MNLLITTGPTREYIDSVRFISNASSGRMGCAVAAAARPICESVFGELQGDPGCRLVPFTSVVDLQRALAEYFPSCDALVMAAAVGDFTLAEPLMKKIRRTDGPITLTLTPTPDVLAGVAVGKGANQRIVAFAVEDPPLQAAETKALAELKAKHADFVVVNTSDAFTAPQSQACILSADTTLLSWANRPKQELAEEIVNLLHHANS
jgi:phosphopantothenoylcysteine decarboxylase/phosphopantothenate--cysteine ligase